MNEKFLSPYNPQKTEDTIYKMWEESGFFNPDEMIAAGLTNSEAEAFSMVLPPPNVTGTLHTGHASMLAIEDIMARYNRMLGKKTLWLPGTDHAAIATQSKVEKILAKEKIRKHELGREKFLERVEAFAQESHDTIVSQCKKMGASLDWSREAFTLDKERENAVYTAFKRMYDDGLIYKAHRIVNWDVKGQTVISDDEIVHVERDAEMYTFKYSSNFPISISTTRPETKVGDSAVAVHPDDERYQQYIGKTYDVNFCGSDISIKIIADYHVDPEFGTGALGVTPAHSTADWEIAERNPDIKVVKVINEYGKMMNCGEILDDMKVAAARKRVVQWFKDENLLEKSETIKQNVSTAERTGGIIEPLPKMQWWIDTEKKFLFKSDKIKGIKKGEMISMKEVMLHVVRDNQINILPDRFEKVYFNWIENLRPWNISRQIWYGHRIPVWYDKKGNINLPEEKTIYFARHGQSEDNVSNIISRPDTPLTEIGKTQARELGTNLKGKQISKIYSSPYPRALETAKIIAKIIGAEIEVKQELHEIKSGQWEGAPVSSMDPEKKVTTQLDPIKGGETYNDFINRLSIIKKSIHKNFEDNSLVVSHTGFLSCLFSHLDGKEEISDFNYADEHQRFKNGSSKKRTFLIEPQGDNLIQDEDTLDTWFSSGLWTFSTLGWPNEDALDFKTYHPTQILETGHDLIFFWVARMILMTTYLLGDIPFETVYFHGLVRDSKGRKMSKSLGNIVDPRDLTETYGTDALRMAMIVGNGPGNDVNLDEQKIKAYSKFANKLWNITRFVLTETEGIDISSSITYSKRDSELIQEQNTFIQEITKEMNEFKYYLVSEKIYHYAWHTFADEILEESKNIFENGTNEEKRSRKYLLLHTLKTIITILHPFMPFITEEIWQEIKNDKDRDILMTVLWPKY